MTLKEQPFQTAFVWQTVDLAQVKRYALDIPRPEMFGKPLVKLN